MIESIGTRLLAGFVILMVGGTGVLLVGGFLVVTAGLFTKRGGDLKRSAVIKAAFFWLAMAVLAWLVGGLAT